MRKIAKYPEREREKINCSFDFLRENLKIAPYFSIKSMPQSSVQIKIVSNPLIKAIAVCQDKNVTWHQDLEDVYVVIDNYGNRKGTSFLGLFDGANGISAAQTTSAELPLLFLDRLSRGDSSYEVSQEGKKVLDSFRTIFRADYKIRENIFTSRKVKNKRFSLKTYEWIHKAYAKAFWRMDRLLRLGRNETSRVCWSSCTAVTCLVETKRNEKQRQDEEAEIRSASKGSEKRLNVTEQEERLTERFTGAKRKSNREEETGSTTEQDEEATERREGQISTKLEEKDLSEEMSREIKKSSTEQGIGETIELQRKESLGNVNGKKEENTIQQEELLPERIIRAKAKSPAGQESNSITDYEREEPTERVNDDTKEQNIIQLKEEEVYEMTIKEKTASNMEQETGNTIMEYSRKESTDRMNAKKEQDIIPQDKEEQAELPEWTIREKEKSTMEEQQEQPCEINNQIIKTGKDEQSTKQKDGLQEKGLLENNTSSDKVSDGLMHIANIGNVHAVLCKNGICYWLTKEHTTYCRKEKIRVIRNGGLISSNEPKGLIEGLTKNTRGLGHHGNPQLKKTVIPVPHTLSIPVDDSCQFLILATSGLWEVLDKSEVVLLTFTMFSAYLEKYQYVQLKKSHLSKDSKLPLSGLADEFYLWYSSPDFSPDRDKNQSQNNNAQLLPPINSTKKKTPTQSRSFRTDSEDEESESALEPSSTDTSSSEETTKSLGSTAGSGIPAVSSQRVDNKSDASLQISTDSEESSGTFYDLAAKYISKQLVRAALKAGSRDNVTVLVVLLNGCDKIPKYSSYL